MRTLLATITCAFFTGTVLAQPSAFLFDAGGLPTDCIIGSGRVAEAKGRDPVVTVEEGACVNFDAARGGVFVRSSAEDVLAQEMSALTIVLRYRASSVATAPVYFERLVNGSSDTAGFLRFRAQSNSGDDHQRTGTLRFYVKDAAGQSLVATSTAPFQQDEGQWYAVGMVFDGGTVSFYVNGEQLGAPVALTATKLPSVEGMPFFIRCGYGFVGSFDDLIVVPGKALDSAQVQALQRSDLNAGEIAKVLE